jgi:serine/threonine-protein kinase
MIGRRFDDRFSITALLAEGAMGSVFRATQEGSTTEVAVKVLAPRLAEDPARRARFEHEAAMLARIDHPNTARVLHHGTQGIVPYLVMDLVEGRELFDVLAQAGRLSSARAASIVIQVCDVLATAHDVGIIHRDLKPENIMLTGDPASPEGERVKLVDFGAAKQLGSLAEEDEDSITAVGTIIGTPGYMSPEQCLGTAVDARSDVYACGAVLYHLVTGRPPFHDADALDTLLRHVDEAPRPPGEIVANLDPALGATILRALSKRREDRQQSAVELWEELLDELPHLSRAAVPSGANAADSRLHATAPRARESGSRISRAFRRHAWVPVALAIGVFGLSAWTDCSLR